MNSIFVGIPSYIDYEVPLTIEHCIKQAKFPEMLRFGVCLQYDEDEVKGTHAGCLDELAKKYPIKINKFHYTKSKGGAWARHNAHTLYDGEDYALHIDAHSRFIKNWDELAVKDFEDCQKRYDKPILSMLAPSYHRDDKAGLDTMFKHVGNLDYITIPKPEHVAGDYWIHAGGYENERHTEFKNIEVMKLYLGFCFVNAQWHEEIPHDPSHYYTGEEIALSIRSYTHGYDILTPKQILVWHRVHPGKNVKHAHIHPEADVKRLHTRAMGRMRALIEGGDLGKYGIGTERTISDYEKFAGVDFKNQKVCNAEC